MTRLTSSQLGPAILFGGVPFYLGFAFWFFPNIMSKLFRASSVFAPKLGEKLYSPKAMKIIGVCWWGFGVVMWADILFF